MGIQVSSYLAATKKMNAMILLYYSEPPFWMHLI